MNGNDDAWRDEIPKFARTLQIIVAALVAGTVAFFVVALVVTASRPADADKPDQWTLTWAALAFLGVAIVARAVVPGAIVRIGRKKIAQGTFQLPQARQASQQPSVQTLARMGDPGMLLVLRQTKTIIGAALLEGAAFFQLIAYIIERHSVLLAAAGALIVALALHVPTRSGLTTWIEDQLRLLGEERSMER